MDNISICVSFIATILGIAYPILLEVVSRLDEKYSSQIIIDLFSKEKEKKYFSIALIISLISIILWILKLPPLFKLNGFNSFFGNSAEYLLILATAFLIIVFFLFVKKILIYYTPTKFIPYLIKRHDKQPDADNNLFFRAISDLLFFSINKQNEAIAKTISGFMYDAFKVIRDKSSNAEVVYPSAYYELVSKTIEELATVKNRRLIFLGHRTAGSVWILGEFGNSKISENTYSWMWSNLQLALSYDRSDFVIYHWEQAFQYIRHSLDYIRAEHSDKTFEITNQEEIYQRLTDRKRFLEFHYALGGLLLYKGKYDCIKRAFAYTQSTPPQYELLPDSMNEVFDLYFDFRDPYEMKHPWISSRYYFPDTGGINSDGVIKKWICEYIAVLFVRQYSIVPYLVYMAPLNAPNIPSTQAEKRKWIDNLDYFKRLVNEVLKNKDLLTTIGLSFVTDEWCEENKKPKPLEFIEKLKQDVINSFEGTLIDQTISDGKVIKFKETSIGMLTPIFNQYEIINNKNELKGELNKWYLYGSSHLIDKSGFADNQEAAHLNFDSFLPEGFSNKFRDFASEIFVLATSKSYLLNSADIIQAIIKMNIDINDYLIISFGIDFKTLIKESNYEFLNGIEVITFDFRNYHLVGDSLFLLKKQDLPKLVYKEIKEEEVNKYSLEKVIDKYNLYLTVVDLNQSEDLRNTFADTSKDKDLRKQVYMAIFINLEVQWKKDLKCIQIKQASPYRERGIINKLTDINAIDEKPSR